jgi:hypothetical protein
MGVPLGYGNGQAATTAMRSPWLAFTVAGFERCEVPSEA